MLYCRTFSSSLDRTTLNWYYRLPSQSIRSWEQLAEAFIGRFMTSRASPKQVDSMTALRKRSGESLREYAARYVDVYNDVDDCTDKQDVTMFRLGLLFGENLRESLTLIPVETFPDLMERVEQYAKF